MEKSGTIKSKPFPAKFNVNIYDIGGEGISFHDTDSTNSGSGRLNPADGSYLNEFRMNEAVDISYTKFRNPAIDNSPYNVTEPEKDQLYVGWTEPGEWINYTVQVKKSGKYKIGVMYTASGDGAIALDFDGKQLTSDLLIPSTRNENEPIDWRQWHHWNKIDSLTTVELKKGTTCVNVKNHFKWQYELRLP